MLTCAPRAAADGADSDQRYTLEARLDPLAGRVQGRGRIQFRNHSRAPLHELLFHLYANAFAHKRTVFMREGGASIRGGRFERSGGIDVTRLTLAGGEDLLARADHALVPDDATQMRVPLPRPIAPGEAVELHVEFSVRLPSLFARMGQGGEFFMIAQWFPKLARLTSDGRWSGFPYHGLGEFDADFADYDVSVTAPARFALAAPGELVQRRELPDGSRRERYVLRAALDVAWAAFPHFRRTSERAGDVQIDVFAPPGQLVLARRQATLVRDGLAVLGARLGPYPYDRIVLILPPPEGQGAFGMEYPGLIVGAVAAWHARVNPAAHAVHDVVTAHELAHQWFPMVVASNEVAAPVLDEGLAEWLGLHLVRDAHGPRSFWLRLFGLPLEVFAVPRAAYLGARNPPSSLLPAYRYRPSELAPAVYLRPALALEAIRRKWGERRLWSALSRYARTHRFAHPGIEDLLAAFDASYWPGFGEHMLRPALMGGAPGAALLPGEPRDEVERAPGWSASPLLARVLLWAQAIIAGLGP